MIHRGHRKRLKKKFLNYGIDALEKHEVLELLLYYAIPRRDTNVVAHKLIEACGSLSGVFDASHSTLVNVEGVGEHTAILISLIPGISRLYNEDKSMDFNKVMTRDKIISTMCDKFIGRSNEHVVLMLLDAKLKMLFCGVMNEGTINKTDVYIRKLVDCCVRHNASYAVMAHNHPSGVALPSSEDLRTTQSVMYALSCINVKLIDHIIVADGDCISIAESDIYCDIFKQERGV